MTTMSNWDGSTESGTDTRHNVDVAHRAFAMLVCARIFVLKCLLEKLPSDTDAETARRRWVLVQAMPPIDLATDIFVAVFRSLRGADKADPIDFTESMLKGVKDILGPDVFP